MDYYRHAFWLLSFTFLEATHCLARANPGTNPPRPNVVNFRQRELYPSSLVFHEKTDKFFVSSLRLGQIGTVSWTGKYEKWVDAPDLISTTGLFIDLPRNRLLVLVIDPGVSRRSRLETRYKLAKLISFDLDSRQRLETIDLSQLGDGYRLPSHVSVLEDGRMVVTDPGNDAVYIRSPSENWVYWRHPLTNRSTAPDMIPLAYAPRFGFMTFLRAFRIPGSFRVEGPAFRNSSLKADWSLKSKRKDWPERLDDLAWLGGNQVVGISSTPPFAQLFEIEGERRVLPVSRSKTQLEEPVGIARVESSVYVLDAGQKDLFGGNFRNRSSSRIVRVVFKDPGP